jgi:hypothetical protein
MIFLQTLDILQLRLPAVVKLHQNQYHVEQNATNMVCCNIDIHSTRIKRLISNEYQKRLARKLKRIDHIHPSICMEICPIADKLGLISIATLWVSILTLFEHLYMDCSVCCSSNPIYFYYH